MYDPADNTPDTCPQNKTRTYDTTREREKARTYLLASDSPVGVHSRLAVHSGISAPRHTSVTCRTFSPDMGQNVTTAKPRYSSNVFTASEANSDAPLVRQ